VTTFDSFESLGGMRREAVVDLLYRLADDELLIGHCDSQSTGLAPSSEEGAAFSSMARDETAHAHSYYQMLHELGEPDPDTLAFARKPRQFRCASLVCLLGGDWAFSVIRRFLYDAQESVRLAALSESMFTPLARLAGKLRSDEKNHLTQGRNWVLRLGDSTGAIRKGLQEALDFAYPHALGLFEPTEADEPLAQSGICPREEQLRREWESAVAPVFDDVRLTVPENVDPAYGGRVGQHPESLTQLLDDIRLTHKTGQPAKR
jgi:ring-1,2-phenylacetyl-CoA epoxidase subunit PaaC